MSPRRRDEQTETFPTVEAAALELHTADELRVLARLTGEGRLPTRKADLAKVIARHLEGDGLRRVWDSLDDIQQAAVAEVAHAPGNRYDEDRFFAKYGTGPTWGSLDRYGRDRCPTPLRLLLFRGVLPEDLAERLRDFVPPQDEARLQTSDEVDVPVSVEDALLRIHASEARARREVGTVLRLVDAGKVQVSARTGRPTDASVKAVAEVLDGGDFYAPRSGAGRAAAEEPGPIRAFAWPMLLQAGGLATATGRKLALSAAGRRALTAAPETVIRTLWKRWTTNTLLDELSRVEAIKGQKGKGGRHLVAVRRRRDALVEGLKAAPVGAWFRRKALVSHLCAIGVDYQVARNAWGLHAGHPEYDSFGYEDRADLLDDRYLACFLFEYAATLGVVDVAYVPPDDMPSDGSWGWLEELPYVSRYDGLLGIRLTALGAYCLGRDTAYAPPKPEEAPGTAPVLRVLPNHEIVALVETVDAADRLALDVVAVPTSERTWRLEAARLVEAFERGHAPAEVRAFLEGKSAAPLPASVLRQLADLEERTGALEDAGPARLVACRDATLAVLIANHTKTRRHCQLAGERHLAVPEGSDAAFRRGLRAIGYVLR